jgi:hypothetical protein
MRADEMLQTGAGALFRLTEAPSANAALALIHLTCGPVTLTLPHEHEHEHMLA